MRSVSSMDAVFNTLCDGNLDKDEFEAAVNTVTRGDSLDELSRQPTDDIQASSLVEVLDRLSWVLSDRLPTFDAASRDMLQRNSKPSRWIRYWLPATALLISSSTILRIVANRKAEIVDWIRELGSTVIDFWRNWVIEPTRKIIGTIRHDESSEVSIMSKRSLQGDQESLQRMVVDFAVDNPEGRALNETQIAEIRSKVQEGDLTPVLMAYERELKSPLYGSVRGNLIRTLLIQIQKTKVDVEVAMGGIDNLLKSQELVFGYGCCQTPWRWSKCFTDIEQIRWSDSRDPRLLRALPLAWKSIEYETACRERAKAVAFSSSFTVCQSSRFAKAVAYSAKQH